MDNQIPHIQKLILCSIRFYDVTSYSLVLNLDFTSLAFTKPKVMPQMIPLKTFQPNSVKFAIWILTVPSQEG